MRTRTPGRAARVAVTEPGGAVFLFRYANEEVGVHWAIPGGGLEDGETPRAAARREVLEETGWSDVEPLGVLWTWEHDFTRAGVPVRPHENIFLGHGPFRPPTGDLAAAHRADAILRWKWWTPREPAGTTDALWPPRLPEPLARLRTEARPSSPSSSATFPDPRPAERRIARIRTARTRPGNRSPARPARCPQPGPRARPGPAGPLPG